jgi:hypothetical protein
VHWLRVAAVPVFPATLMPGIWPPRGLKARTPRLRESGVVLSRATTKGFGTYVTLYS